MMTDETPVLRADATDDDSAERGTEVEGHALSAREGRLDQIEVRPVAVLSVQEGLDLAETRPVTADVMYEPYENGEGGWSFRRVVG